MGSLRLRPWPFEKNENVELYWMGSVFQSPAQLWFLRCVFKRDNSEFKEIELPWATLPGLIIGRQYKNGILETDLLKQDAIQVDISADTVFETCCCSEVPKGLYDLKKIAGYKQELLCKFKVGTCNYYIPCVEIVRSVLAPYQTFANQILSPNGLEDFVERERDNGDTYEIDLSREYPKKLLRSEIVAYFVWLRTNERACSEWNAVYKNLMLAAMKIAPVHPPIAFTWGVPIRALPPISVDSTWKFSGVKCKNNYFMQELVYRDGVDMKYTHIKYNHPALENINKVNKPRNKRTVNKGRPKKKGETVLDKNRLPSSRRKTVTSVEQPTVKFRFHEHIISEKLKVGSRDVNIGGYQKTQSKFRNNNGNNISIATTQDWTLDGKMNSIEFNTLELVKVKPQRGLERFFKIITLIKKYCINLEFYFSVAYLQDDRIFAQNDNGCKRTCAFIKAYNKKVLQCYILEFSRSDEWPISTLYIFPLSPNYSDQDFEKVSIKLLNCAIDNAGHWDNSALNNEPEFRFEMTKHVPGQSIERWAEIVVDKILVH